MTLPKRIPKPGKRASRWRSAVHCNWIRGFACCVCGSMSNISAAHVRLGSNAGIGQKPDDWRTVPLCDGVNADGLYACHKRQHVIGEKSFWKDTDVEALIREFIKASPKRREIEQEMQERGIA